MPKINQGKDSAAYFGRTGVWHNTRRERGVRTKSWIPKALKGAKSIMYSKEQIEASLKLYHQCGSVTKTTRVLGYPSKRELYEWILNEGTVKPARKDYSLLIRQSIPETHLLKLRWTQFFCYALLSPVVGTIVAERKKRISADRPQMGNLSESLDFKTFHVLLILDP